MARKASSDEAWVLDLCDELIGEPSTRQKTFDWLRGDRSPKTGQARKLPVDAYWQQASTVVEYRERQHFEPVAHFDKPGRLTISGIPRREQRALYDLRREELIPEKGIRLVVIAATDLDCDKRFRLRRNRKHDLAALTLLLRP